MAKCQADMQIIHYRDPPSFIAASLPFLMRNEAANNLIMGAIRRRLSHSDGERGYMATVITADQIIAVADWQLRHRVLLASDSTAAIKLLAQDMADQRCEPISVVGAQENVLTFALIWQDLTGCGYRQRFQLREHRLTALPVLPEVSGRMRFSTANDRTLLWRWMQAFIQELRMVDDPEVLKPVFLRSVEEAKLALWEQEEIVAMAGFRAIADDAARIGPVFTPPEHRRLGYAGALVAHLSHWLLDYGNRVCYLSTDVSNPTSNAIYRRIGYEPTHDQYHFDLFRV